MERLDPMAERERSACVRYLRAEAERVHGEQRRYGVSHYGMQLSGEVDALRRAADEIEKGAEERYFGDGD